MLLLLLLLRMLSISYPLLTLPLLLLLRMLSISYPLLTLPLLLLQGQIILLPLPHPCFQRGQILLSLLQLCAWAALVLLPCRKTRGPQLPVPRSHKL